MLERLPTAEQRQEVDFSPLRTRSIRNRQSAGFLNSSGLLLIVLNMSEVAPAATLSLVNRTLKFVLWAVAHNDSRCNRTEEWVTALSAAITPLMRYRAANTPRESEDSPDRSRHGIGNKPSPEPRSIAEGRDSRRHPLFSTPAIK